jgi:hypothetical protein
MAEVREQRDISLSVHIYLHLRRANAICIAFMIMLAPNYSVARLPSFPLLAESLQGCVGIAEPSNLVFHSFGTFKRPLVTL